MNIYLAMGGTRAFIASPIIVNVLGVFSERAQAHAFLEKWKAEKQTYMLPEHIIAFVDEWDVQ